MVGWVGVGGRLGGVGVGASGWVLVDGLAAHGLVAVVDGLVCWAAWRWAVW